MDMNKAKMINDAVVSTVERKAEERGADTKTIEFALKMLEENEPVKKIVKYTGLTVEQIEEIRDNLS